jgi:hypothetical protein
VTTPGTLLEQAEAVAARVFAGDAGPAPQREFALAALRRVPVDLGEELRIIVGQLADVYMQHGPARPHEPRRDPPAPPGAVNEGKPEPAVGGSTDAQ